MFLSYLELLVARPDFREGRPILEAMERRAYSPRPTCRVRCQKWSADSAETSRWGSFSGTAAADACVSRLDFFSGAVVVPPQLHALACAITLSTAKTWHVVPAATHACQTACA